MRILVNKIKCVHCGDVIESNSTHGLVYCGCSKVAVDGGLEYLRRIANSKEDFIELSEVEEN